MTQIPTTMRAVVTTGNGGFEVLDYREDWPVPSPGPDQVLVRVSATGMNNTDVNTRSGWYSKSVTEATTGDAFDNAGSGDNTWGGAGIKFPRIQGADVCGTVVLAGANAEQGLVGKRVIADNWLRDWDDPHNKEKTGYFGSECDGGYAEYTLIDHRNIGAIECDWTDAELATLSCSYTTAEGMLSRANVCSGDRVLITGASGGVGSALIQLAKRRGALPIGLASDATHDEVLAAGADFVLPRGPEDLGTALQKATGKSEGSVVADIVGGPYFPTLIEVLERGGRYTCSGAIAGPIVELDLRTLYLRDLTFTGSTVVPPQIFRNLISYVEAGEIKPLLAATYPLKDFVQGQKDFIAKKHTGNIVVTM